MTDVVFYFQVHQPYRLRRYSFFEIGKSSSYFDDYENERLLRRVSERCYLPMNQLLAELIEKHGGRFRCSFSLSGVVLDQLERWAPDALQSFVDLSKTGAVEFLCETSQHSLSFTEDLKEFEAQIASHRDRIEKLFGQRATTFRNTELVCNNDIAHLVEGMGFRAILAEGAEHLMGWRSPHRVYRPEGCEKMKTLLRSFRYSDDIAFRFSNQGWSEWPLTAERFAQWLHRLPEDDSYVGLFMDYETFGEHQWKETGIFDFMRSLPEQILSHPRFGFATPGEIAEREDPIARLDMPHPVSWADAERDMTAWLGNPMQREAHESLYRMGADARFVGEEYPKLLSTWRRLTTSDHVYYMSTKYLSDGEVHKFFSPYQTPHDAFIAFMNVIEDLGRRIRDAKTELLRSKDAPSAQMV
ncbi:MAG: alpha-amylase [Planctomycetota bacterium]|nr:MAG: alpha-amylase [Planctomycetota bacterium]